MLKKVNYPNLMQLMAKYGVSRNDIAITIGKSYRHTLSKFYKKVTFDIIEAYKIVSLFKGLGENITMEFVFFDEVVTNETDIA